jgi:hypothetical protein
MGIQLMLTGVRCAFLVLGDPEDYQGNKQFRWSATALVPNGSALKTAIENALIAVAEEKWPKKGQAKYEAILMDPKTCCFTDGKRKPDYDGFAGHWALTAHRYQEKGRPLVFDKDKSPIYKPTNELYEGKAGKIYPGMFTNMHVEFWAQDNRNGNGLRCTLLGIQAAKDGDAFGGGAAVNPEAFGEVTEGADAEDLG